MPQTENQIDQQAKITKKKKNQENCSQTLHIMMVFSFSSSTLAHTPKSSLNSNPTPFRKIKNPKIFLGSSNFHPARSISHFFVDSPLRASVKCFSQEPSSTGEEKQQLVQEVEAEEQVYEFERLFSNLNQATLKREPGINSQYISFS